MESTTYERQKPTSSTTFAGYSSYEVLAAKIKIQRDTQARINAALKQHKLSINSWLILGQLADSENPLLMHEFADALGVSPPFVTKLVRSMVKRKLLADSRSDVDQRRHLISITIEGRELLAESEVTVRRVLRSWLSVLPPENVLGYIQTVMLVSKL